MWWIDFQCNCVRCREFFISHFIMTRIWIAGNGQRQSNSLYLFWYNTENTNLLTLIVQNLRKSIGLINEQQFERHRPNDSKISGQQRGSSLATVANNHFVVLYFTEDYFSKTELTSLVFSTIEQRWNSCWRTRQWPDLSHQRRRFTRTLRDSLAVFHGRLVPDASRPTRCDNTMTSFIQSQV